MGLAAELKAYAREVGFHLIGITSPAPFAQAELDITRWLNAGHQGDMAWLNAARTRLATRPDELLPGARSLIVVGVSYRTIEPDPDTTQSSVLSDVPAGRPRRTLRLGGRLPRRHEVAIAPPGQLSLRQG